MSALNKLKTIDGQTENQFNAEPAQMVGLLVVAEGTNKSGQTGGLADIGRFVIERNGVPQINRNCKKFGDINDIRGGIFTLDSTAGSDFAAAVTIPFFEKGHPNALDITGEKELNIRFIPADPSATVFSNLSVTVESLHAQIPERYNYKILGADQSYASAVNADRTPLNQANVTALYLEDVDDIVEAVQFESSDQVVVSNNSLLALRAYTNANNRIEDNTFKIVEIENHTPGVPSSTQNFNNNIRFTTTGAGNVDLTVCSIDWLKN